MKEIQKEEALANIQEVIELYLKPVEDDFDFAQYRTNGNSHITKVPNLHYEKLSKRYVEMNG